MIVLPLFSHAQSLLNARTTHSYSLCASPPTYCSSEQPMCPQCQAPLRHYKQDPFFDDLISSIFRSSTITAVQHALTENIRPMHATNHSPAHMTAGEGPTQHQPSIEHTDLADTVVQEDAASEQTREMGKAEKALARNAAGVPKSRPRSATGESVPGDERKSDAPPVNKKARTYHLHADHSVVSASLRAPGSTTTKSPRDKSYLGDDDATQEDGSSLEKEYDNEERGATGNTYADAFATAAKNTPPPIIHPQKQQKRANAAKRRSTVPTAKAGTVIDSDGFHDADEDHDNEDIATHEYRYNRKHDQPRKQHYAETSSDKSNSSTPRERAVYLAKKHPLSKELGLSSIVHGTVIIHIVEPKKSIDPFELPRKPSSPQPALHAVINSIGNRFRTLYCPATATVGHIASVLLQGIRQKYQHSMAQHALSFGNNASHNNKNESLTKTWMLLDEHIVNSSLKESHIDIAMVSEVSASHDCTALYEEGSSRALKRDVNVRKLMYAMGDCTGDLVLTYDVKKSVS